MYKPCMKGSSTCQQCAAQPKHPWDSSPPPCASPPSWLQASKQSSALYAAPARTLDGSCTGDVLYNVIGFQSPLLDSLCLIKVQHKQMTMQPTHAKLCKVVSNSQRYSQPNYRLLAYPHMQPTSIKLTDKVLMSRQAWHQYCNCCHMSQLFKLQPARCLNKQRVP